MEHIHVTTIQARDAMQGLGHQGINPSISFLRLQRKEMLSALMPNL
jgi:hypothetical protein